METATLKLFLDVIRENSFTVVAQQQGIAPSSVSRAIANLESELGILLFQRSTRKLQATEAGQLYYQRVAPLLTELEAAALMATDINQQARGRVRVTCASVYGHRHIVPLLPELKQRYPALELDLLLTDNYMDLIAERIDVAIRIGTLSDSALIASKLAEMRFYICASPAYLQQRGYPQLPAEVHQHDCILFPRPGHNLNWLFKNAHGQIEEIAIDGAYLLTNSAGIRELVLADMGLALLPDWLVEKDIQSGRLVELFPDYAVSATDFSSAVWLLRPSRDYLPLKTRVFLEFLQEKLRR